MHRHTIRFQTFDVASISIPALLLWVRSVHIAICLASNWLTGGENNG